MSKLRTDRELMQQALEALESYTPGDYSTGHVIHPSIDEDALIKAISALREMLAQPEREWVGLTDEEIERACVPLGAAMLSFTEVARAIEAKLKERNT